MAPKVKAPQVLARNTDTGETVLVDTDALARGMADGSLAPNGPVTVNVGGGQTNTENAANALGRGAGVEDVSHAAASQVAEDREKALAGRWFDTATRNLQNALTAGLAGDKSEEAEAEDRVNRKAVIGGQFLGGALLGKTPGIVGYLTGQGGEFGRAVAGAAGLEGAAGAVAAKAGSHVVSSALSSGLEQAGSGAAFGSAAALGNQVSNALHGDKDFSMEAVAKEAGTTALLSGGIGLFSGLAKALGKGTLGDVKAQGGLLDPKSAEYRDVVTATHQAVSALDSATDALAGQHHIAEVIRGETDVPLDPELMDIRGEAATRAQAARTALHKTIEAAGGMDKALLDPDFHEALDDYQDATRDLSSKMNLSNTETAARVKLGKPEDVLGAGQPFINPEDMPLDARKALGDWNEHLNQAMRTPEGGPTRAALEYDAANGREFQPVPRGVNAETTQVTGPEEGSAPPDASTRPNGPPTPSPASTVGHLDALKGPGFDRAAFERARAMGRVQPTTRDLSGGKYIEPAPGTVASDNALNQAYSPERLFKDANGYMTPESAKVANDSANAGADRGFAERMATDSRAVRNAGQMGPTAPEAAPEHVTTPSGDVVSADWWNPIKEQLQGMAPPKPGPNVRRFMDEWAAKSDQYGPVNDPGEAAAQKIRDLTNQIYTASSGQLDAAAALEQGAKHGFEPPRSSLTSALQSVAMLQKTAGEAAEMAKGGTAGTRGKSWVKKGIGGMLGREVANAAGVRGVGRLGLEALGAHVAGGYAGAAFSMAASAGRLATRIAQTAAKLVEGRRGIALAAAVVNRAYAYSDKGPIKDPVARIQEIRQMAAAPDAIRASVQARLGDLVQVDPEAASKIVEHQVNQIVSLSRKAPLIAYSPLGEPLKPAAQALRQFLEYENGTHNLDTVLTKIGNGSATKAEVDSVKDTAPQTFTRLIQETLEAHESFADKSRPALAKIEAATGIPLTRAAKDPGFILRIQSDWNTPPAPQGGGGGQNAAQIAHLKSGAQAQATPAQGSPSGRAPGN